jgi:putative transposase
MVQYDTVRYDMVKTPCMASLRKKQKQNMDKYQNKYRIPSARLQHWNYGAMGSYFITICTQHRQHYFGEISNGNMQLSEIGKLVQTEWLKTFIMRPDMNLEMGNFVVMPNHFHAVIIIGENEYNAVHGFSVDGITVDGITVDGITVDGITVDGITVDGIAVDGITVDGIAVDGITVDGRDAMHGVSTNNPNNPNNPDNMDNPINTNNTNHTNHAKIETNNANAFGPQSKNLASIVRGFKSSVTKQARLIHADFEWQSRFHDHIIRNTQSFEKIQHYIANNPLNWREDKFNH